MTKNHVPVSREHKHKLILSRLESNIAEYQKSSTALHALHILQSASQLYEIHCNSKPVELDRPTVVLDFHGDPI